MNAESTKKTILLRTVHNPGSIEDHVAQAANGDKKAQQHIYTELSGVLYSICLRYVGNGNDANDVFQDGFVRIFDSLKQFSHRGSFEGWAKRIMVNTALTHIRRRRPLGSELDLDTIELVSSDEEILSRMTADELLRLVRDLPDGYREVFSLFGIEGYSHSEIAEKLNISEGNSKLRMNRARRMLQQRVTELMQVA